MARLGLRRLRHDARAQLRVRSSPGISMITVSPILSVPRTARYSGIIASGQVRLAAEPARRAILSKTTANRKDKRGHRHKTGATPAESSPS